MNVKCFLSRGCFPGCSRVTRCCAHTPGWTNWFVPSGVHLERGHRYGMHTSPGGRWCHFGTCPLHSQPVSTAQIYLHSLLFSRTGNGRGSVCVFLMEFAIAGRQKYYCHFFLIFTKQYHYFCNVHFSFSLT